jgi:GAF domain-containing protein
LSDTDEIQFVQSLGRLDPITVAAPRGDAGALAEVLRVAVRFAGADAGNIQRLVRGAPGGAGTLELRIVAHQGFGDEFLSFFGCVEPGIAACGLALARRERVITEDVRTDPHLASPVRAALERAGFLSVVSTPVVDEAGEILGMLSVQYRRAGRPTAEVLARLDTLAARAAAVLGRDQTRG